MAKPEDNPGAAASAAARNNPGQIRAAAAKARNALNRLRVKVGEDDVDVQEVEAALVEVEKLDDAQVGVV